jgi:ATP-binding cassette subfamily G (WHITE) protein 2 (PDR)
MSATLGVVGEVPTHKAPVGGHTNGESRSSSETEQTDTEKQQNRQVQDLLDVLTSSSSQRDFESPFAAADDSRLNPTSDQFRAKDWARAFYNLRYGSQESCHRVAGVAFKDLNVWGRGTPTDFQSTVGNKILKIPSLFSRGAQRIDILRNLDGLLLPGEQLCVLGPPGYYIASYYRIKC